MKRSPIRRFFWLLFPPSKIVLYRRGIWMYSLPGYTVEDWARHYEPEYYRKIMFQPRMEREKYLYRLYREKLALPFHGWLTPEAERIILSDLSQK